MGGVGGRGGGRLGHMRRGGRFDYDISARFRIARPLGGRVVRGGGKAGRGNTWGRGQ